MSRHALAGPNRSIDTWTAVLHARALLRPTIIARLDRARAGQPEYEGHRRLTEPATAVMRIDGQPFHYNPPWRHP